MNLNEVSAKQIVDGIEEEIQYYQSKVNHTDNLKAKYVDRNADRLHEYQVQVTLRGLVSDIKLYEEKIKSLQGIIDKIVKISDAISSNQSNK